MKIVNIESDIEWFIKAFNITVFWDNIRLMFVNNNFRHFSY
jgi:hypothetical protein